jgi:hypothetical protein
MCALIRVGLEHRAQHANQARLYPSAQRRFHVNRKPTVR